METLHAVKNKVRNLLRLADSNQNPSEAANAMAAAVRLCTRHNIQISDIDTEYRDDLVAGEVATKFILSAKRLVTWRKLLIHGVAAAYGLRVCTTLLYDGSRDYHFVGQAREISAAKYMLKFAERQVTRLYNETRTSHGVARGRSFALNFKIGVADEISRRLPKLCDALEENESNPGEMEETGLVPTNQLARYIKDSESAIQRFIDESCATTRKSRFTQRNAHAYTAGRVAGATVNTSNRKALDACTN